MALDTEGRALGVKNILRRLRGAAPKPLSSEDRIEGFMEGQEGGANPLTPPTAPGPGPSSEEVEATLKGTSPGKPRAPLTPPRTLR